jgi:hypothetical protein
MAYSNAKKGNESYHLQASRTRIRNPPSFAVNKKVETKLMSSGNTFALLRRRLNVIAKTNWQPPYRSDFGVSAQSNADAHGSLRLPLKTPYDEAYRLWSQYPGGF